MAQGEQRRCQGTALPPPPGTYPALWHQRAAGAAICVRALGPQSPPEITVFVTAGSERGLTHLSGVTQTVDWFQLCLNQHCPQQEEERGGDFLRNQNKDGPRIPSQPALCSAGPRVGSIGTRSTEGMSSAIPHGAHSPGSQNLVERESGSPAPK